MNQIYPQVWINLPREVRAHLTFVFKLERTGVTEIRDQTVVSDGYTVEDLQKITLEKMCEYIGSQESFVRAWEITLAKVHAELNPPIAIIQNINGEPTAVDFAGTPPTVEDESNLTVAEVIQEMERWCDTCDSKGVRHKIDCPKFVKPKSHDTI